nr:hypothetical protein [Kibdelosporangium sp. MJ126-NF4]
MDTFGSVREHLRVHALPEIAVITVVNHLVKGMQITVQLGGFDLADAATGIIAWADTLTRVTCSIWRAADKNVHLNMEGRLPDETLVKVFGGTDYDPDVFGADLAVDDRRVIPLALPRLWSQGNAGVVT